MTREENLATARAFFAAFAARDIETVRALLAPDVAWHVPGKSRISGTHRGPDGVLAYFALLRELSAATFKAEPVDMLAGESGAALLSRASGTRPDGRAYASTYMLHLRVVAGRIVEARLYNDDQAAFEAFWA